MHSSQSPAHNPALRRASVAGPGTAPATRGATRTPPLRDTASPATVAAKPRPSSMILLPRAATPGSHPAASSSSPSFAAANTQPLATAGSHNAPPNGTTTMSAGRMARSATASSIGSAASMSLLAASAATNGSAAADDPACGITVRKTKLFLRRRKAYTERLHLESNRLQTRLRKLLDLGRNPSLTLAQLKEAEQAIVPWEPDAAVLSCRQCASAFSFFNRKHHCRLCGRVVCAACSVTDAYEETLRIRLCVACVDTLGVPLRGEKLVAEAVGGRLAEAFDQLARLRSDVMAAVPKLNELIDKLEALGNVPSDHPLARRIRTLAGTYKKDLDSQFAQITQICEKLSLYNPQSDTESKIKYALVRAHTDLVQSLMSTVNAASDALSKSAKRATGGAASPTTTTSSSSASAAATASKPGSPPVDDDQQGPDSEEYLHALIAQFSQLDFFLKEATDQRQLDTVRTLKVSLDEVVAEIRRVECKVYGESRFQPT